MKHAETIVELKEKRNNLIDALQAAVHPDQLEHTPVLLWGQLADFIQGYVAASQNQSDDYDAQVATSCRMLANSTGPATWIDPVTGKKLYNEAYLSHLLDLVDDGVKDVEVFDLVNASWEKQMNQARIIGANENNAAWHAHIAEIRGKYV